MLVASLVLTACSRQAALQQVLLERAGAVHGQALQSVAVETRRGDVLRIVLEQSGLDLYLQVADHDRRVLGTFDSFTERYGEERAQIKVEQDGPLTLTFGAQRLPKVAGTYRLTVLRTDDEDAAEAHFTDASRQMAEIGTRRRVEQFDSARAKFLAAGRDREAGLAALAATVLLNETASNSKQAVEHGERAVAAFRNWMRRYCGRRH